MNTSPLFCEYYCIMQCRVLFTVGDVCIRSVQDAISQSDSLSRRIALARSVCKWKRWEENGGSKLENRRKKQTAGDQAGSAERKR
jgi:hypothetical protein